MQRTAARQTAGLHSVNWELFIRRTAKEDAAPAELASVEPVIVHYFRRLLRKPPAGLAPVEAMILHYEPRQHVVKNQRSTETSSVGAGLKGCWSLVQNHRSTGTSPAVAAPAQLAGTPRCAWGHVYSILPAAASCTSPTSAVGGENRRISAADRA